MTFLKIDIPKGFENFKAKKIYDLSSIGELYVEFEPRTKRKK